MTYYLLNLIFKIILFDGNDISLNPIVSNSFQVNFDHQDSLNLLAPISHDDIKLASCSMNGLESPGPDGFNPLFYQKFWNYVHPFFCMIIKEMFVTAKIPKGIGETLICLIPKVDNPECCSQFRPISLCNVTYKILTKVLVDRIKHSCLILFPPFRVVLFLGD